MSGKTPKQRLGTPKNGREHAETMISMTPLYFGPDMFQERRHQSACSLAGLPRVLLHYLQFVVALRGVR